MESSKLTDEELIDLALQEQDSLYDNFLDVKPYQDFYCIGNGTDRIFIDHLYWHYKKWSMNPVSKEAFKDTLELNNKKDEFIYVDKKNCNLDFDKLIGEYVKAERKKQKEKRFRKVSSPKPEIKC